MNLKNLIYLLIVGLAFASCGTKSDDSSVTTQPGSATPTPQPFFTSTYHAAQLVGTSTQYMTIGQPANLDFQGQSNSFTISAWFKATSPTSSGVIISRSIASTGLRQVQLSIAGTGRLESYVGGNYIDSSTNVVTDGLWHHVAVVNTLASPATNSTFQTFVDGALVGPSFASGTGVSGTDWLIGARRNASNADAGFLMTGLIDEVAVWNVALPTSALAAIASAGRIGNLTTTIGAYSQTSALVSWWRFGDFAGDSFTSILHDPVGSNNATPVNMTSANDIVGP